MIVKVKTGNKKDELRKDIFVLYSKTCTYLYR